MKIQQAKVSFNPLGTPSSDVFDDVYFSNNDGLAETQYVFIQGNNLLVKWRSCSHESFTIAETGFGTGLNFLLTLSLFNIFRSENPTHPLKRLFFISTEKFPMRRCDLLSALKAWPSLSQFSAQLTHQYPINISGQHRLTFCDHCVILDLHFDDAHQAFLNTHSYCDGLVDVWFLDGFAPSKNDQMWTCALFSQIARLSKDAASFATFTAAGAVKRGLQDVGFDVKKIKGFGRKRDMLVGTFAPQQRFNEHRHLETFEHQHPAFYRAPLLDTAKANSTRAAASVEQPNMSANPSDMDYENRIAIVGGGIASAILAIKLLQRGFKVDLLCADAALAAGASGNDQGGFYPQLNAEAGINTQVHVHSFLYAARFYRQLSLQGFEFAHDWCGVLQLGFNNNLQNRHQKMQQNHLWPKEFIEFVSAEQASKIAKVSIGHPGLFIPNGGWISPPALVQACIRYCETEHTDDFTLRLNSPVVTYDCTENYCNVEVAQNVVSDSSTLDASGDSADQVLNYRYQACILACGAASHTLVKQPIPFRHTRGQVERVHEQTSSQHLSTVLCHKGYMTPSLNQHHALGSTYVKEDMQTDYRASEAKLNVSMHTNAVPEQEWLDEVTTAHLEAVAQDTVPHSKRKAKKQDFEQRGRAAIRCSTPDHLPTVGGVPDIENQKARFADLYKAKPTASYPISEHTQRVFMLTGLGSRGLTTAPLMAELLVSQICKEPLPLQNPLLNALNPNRFLLRALIRREL